MATAILTQDRLRELLHYNPDTGVFTRLKARCSNLVGTQAGCVNKALGYVIVSVLGSPQYGHRLAWLYMTGQEPAGEVDHINGNKADNRWSNLRDVPKLVNMQNNRKARAHNATGLQGVRKSGSRWESMIGHQKRQHYLGSFATPEEAHAAYLEAKRRLHEGCTI